MSARIPGYRSTRSAREEVSFEEAIIRGLALDGGLYLPTFIPKPPESWRDQASFSELGVRVLSEWLTGALDPAALDSIIQDALNFPVPLVPLEGEGWQGVYVLELFHGPTLSFKDFGARSMARFMTHFLQSRGERVTILVATSGDTGSAVADGFSGQKAVEVGLLFPRNQVSPTQERQLIVMRPGVRTFSVAGTFDDCQRVVKEAFQDPNLDSLRLSSANSINIGRLLPQMLYYFEAFRQGEFDDAIVCVPSGNLGNLTAGMMASLAGLPVARFLAAHNANDFFPAFLEAGSTAYRDSVRTLSNAMDVGVPSNFERLTSLFSSDEMRRRIWSTSVGDHDTISSIRRVYNECGYIADPHTAVGLEAARRYRAINGKQLPLVVLSTAHPAKFPEIVEPALGFRIDAPPRLAAIWSEPTLVEEIEAGIGALRDALLGIRA